MKIGGLSIPLIILCTLTVHAQEKRAAVELPARCSEKLVAYADWPKVKSPRFLLDLKAKSGGRLYYLGASHSSDPVAPQFASIEQAWNQVKPTIAFYEGPNRPIAATPEETIRQAGESGFVRFLATRDGIPFVSLEPPPQDEAGYLLKKYSPEQVKLFYILREASRLRERRGASEEELKKAIAQMLLRAAAFKGFENTFANLEELDAAYRRYWTSPVNWWQAPERWFDPLESSTATGGRFTNEINRLSSQYRNLHMASVLAKAALSGQQVFAVVGRNHVPMQDAALVCALN